MSDSDQNGEGTKVNWFRLAWSNPFWIGAITSLITALITIPKMIADIKTQSLITDQEVALAKEKTETIKVQNSTAKQTQEFEILVNTIKQQGEERIFVLRYLSKTLDDDQARTWAAEEVVRLEKIAGERAELNIAKAEKVTKQSMQKQTLNDVTREKLEKEIDALEKEITARDVEIRALEAKAGINVQSLGKFGFSDLGSIEMTISVDIDWSKTESAKKIAFTYGPMVFSKTSEHFTFICEPSDKACEQTYSSDKIGYFPPSEILISNGEGVKRVGVSIDSNNSPFKAIFTANYGSYISFRCFEDPNKKTQLLCRNENLSLKGSLPVDFNSKLRKQP